MPRPSDPVALPDWAWGRDDVESALVARDIGALLRFVQQYGGASQTRLAAATGISQGRISEILAGKKAVTAFEVIERIADGLAMPDPARMRLGLAPRTWIDGNSGSGPPAGRGSSTLTIPTSEEGAVRRREFIGLGVGAAAGLAGIAAALTHYGAPNPDAPRPVRELIAAAGDMKAAYQRCRYGRVDADLPPLLRALDAAATGAAESALHAARAEAYHVAASVLLKRGQGGLAWLAADRAMRAAETSGDAIAVGTSTRVLVRALVRDGHYGTAADLAADSAARITPDSPQSLSVYGALLLTGATAAALGEDRAQADTLLAEADDAGRRLGGDHNHAWTAFGPTNVALHRVNASIELGDAGVAVDQAGGIDLGRIDVVERRAALLVDTGRAYTQWGKIDRAYEALAAAERIAPEELAARPVARNLLREMGDRSVGHLHTRITELAERTALAA
ncbi:helix-turn-helix domain-containing protein [Nocardiopsis coralliicola]